MFLEKIRTEGLAQLSYIFGDDGQAAVIDPRRDCQVYLDIAFREGVSITHVFETHRNEDFVIGSVMAGHSRLILARLRRKGRFSGLETSNSRFSKPLGIPMKVFPML